MSVYKKINQVMEMVDTVYKGANIRMKGGSYRAVQHDDVTKLLHKPMTSAGLVAMSSMESVSVDTFKNTYGNDVYKVEVSASVTFVDVDEPDSRHTVNCMAMAMDSQDKAPGKAFSMAVKYAYLKTFMLESSDREEDRLPEPESKKHQGGTDFEHNPADFVFKFGKFKGMKIDEVNKDDLISYGKWLHEQDPEKNKFVCTSIKTYLMDTGHVQG